jgi:hypothetical protein
LEEKKEHKPYKLVVDQKQHEWPEKLISGSQIKTLANVDQSYGVWQQLPGPDDPEIGDNETVDLSEPGKERFFTGKKTTTEGLDLNVYSSRI